MKQTYNSQALKDRRIELRRNQSLAERILWQKLRNKQFRGLKFFRQYSVGSYILDFYCPRLKLAIELDGGHHSEKEIMEYDEARTDYLKTREIKTIRFWNNDVLQNIEGVFDALEEFVGNTINDSNPLNPP
ncbi:MAG: endonuclease domain-containing protein [Deltaproteobacteria bacterium]|nr:endonuclease domain-containing protein [Deltaproteobacteria bacterium]